MKILLLNPGIICVGKYSSVPMSPMGLLRIGAYFQDHNAQVKMIDCALPPNYSATRLPMKVVYHDAPYVEHRPCGSIQQHIKENMWKPVWYFGKPHDQIKAEMLQAFPDGPDQVWVGSHLTYYYETSWDLVKMAKYIFPRAKVLLGGIYPTLCPEHADGSGADLVVKGRIDDALPYLPDYSLMPYDASIRHFKSSSGCPVNPPCSFCSVGLLDPEFTPMNVDRTVSWVQEQFDMGVKNVTMWSSQLLMPPRTFKDFCRKIIDTGMPDQGLRISASEGIQPSLFKDEMAQLMRAAGFTSINIPVETVSRSLLEDFHKPSDMDDTERSIDLAFKYGFQNIDAFIMLGTPGQSPEQVIESIIYCWKRDVGTRMMAFTPVPGSELYDKSQEFQSREIEYLNPYLWPAAHENLTCLELEEIHEINKLGFDLWYTTGRKSSRIHNIFEKYCEEYGIISDRKYYINDPHRKTTPSQDSREDIRISTAG